MEIHEREIESLLIAENNTLRINYIKADIDNMQQNIKSRLCRERYERVNPIVSEWCELIQKEYKTWHNSVGGGDPLRIEQNIKISLYYQMVFAQTLMTCIKFYRNPAQMIRANVNQQQQQ